MADPSIKIHVADDHSARGSLRRSRKSKALSWVVGGAACVAVALAVYALRRDDGQVDPKPSQTDAHAQTVTNAKSEPSPREVVVDDDGKLLWASPTSGGLIALDYIPDGAQALLHFRPSLVVSHPEGAKVLAGLGPWGEWGVAEVRRALAAELSEMRSLLVTVVILPNGQLDAVFRAELSEPWSDDELAARYPHGASAEFSGQRFRRTGMRCCFLPSQYDRRTLIVCPSDLVESLIETGGQPPTLIRDLQRLWEFSDADRAATLLVAPNFFEAGGTNLFVESGDRLRDALDWLTGREATAVMLSAHWADDFFLELRATPQLQSPPRRFALKLRDRIGASADEVENAILDGSWHRYGRKVLARLPSMLRKLSGYTRVAEEDRMALLRCYLPAVAGHNLLMGGELLITQGVGEAARVAAAPTVAPESLDERLARTTSLSFSKETLERALELLGDDIGLSIEIRGGDLQLEGITKNQSFGIDHRDRPAREILLEILQRANPDRTAESPADPKQKLVYVIQRNDGGRIIVTTRTAAIRRGQALPRIFELQEQ